MTTTYSGEMLALAITSIPCDFFSLEFWAAAIQTWVLVFSSDGVRGKIFIFEGIDDYRGRGELKRSPFFHQYIIHVGSCEPQGSMMSLSVHYSLTIENIQLEV